MAPPVWGVLAGLTGLAGYLPYVRDAWRRVSDPDPAALAPAFEGLDLKFAVSIDGEAEGFTPYAALIAVPTLIAGIYGMNFVHMPELGWKYGYAAVLGLMAAIDGWLFVKLKRSGWL